MLCAQQGKNEEGVAMAEAVGGESAPAQMDLDAAPKKDAEPEAAAEPAGVKKAEEAAGKPENTGAEMKDEQQVPDGAEAGKEAAAEDGLVKGVG